MLARTKYELAWAQLQTGNYIHGFRNYESRWEAAGIIRPVQTDGPLLGEEWRGQNIFGKRVLLHAEQGFGDTIQFIRYAPLVAELGAEVVVEVQPSLRDLAACMSLGCTIGNGIPRGRYDFHCSLIDLPIAFQTTRETVPPPVTLKVPEPADRLSKARIPSSKSTKIGIVWAGNPRNSIDATRSIKLDLLRPLFDSFPSTEFFSFQVGPAAEQLAPFASYVTDLRPHLNTFVDTAAALLRMDRIITVETAVAHLAGNLGLDVWLLLSHAPCWRWLLNTASSPWYPTMKLFRQPTPGDWASVVREILLCAQSPNRID